MPQKNSSILENTLTGTLLLLAVTCFFYACSPPQNVTDTVSPIIQIDYPDTNGLVKNNDTIRFVGDISDDQKLHTMLLTIEGLQGQLYYSYNPVVEGMSSFHFDTPWLVYGIPYDTVGYLNLLVIDQSNNYAYEHWYMRLRL